MKLGDLVRILLFQLLLLDTTVLSHDISIMATKTRVALLLLGSLQFVASNPTKTTVDRCGVTMECFVPFSCKGASMNDMTHIDSTDSITVTCPIILKLRAYSPMMYRVVLESRDESVTEITVAKENSPFLECKLGQEPKFKGVEIKSIRRNEKASLSCEFIVKETTEIFVASSPTSITLSTTNNAFQSAFTEGDLRFFTRETCMYNLIAYDRLPIGTDTIAPEESLVYGLTDISCPSPYQLRTRKTSPTLEDRWKKTTLIDCEKVNGNKFKFTTVREDGKTDLTEKFQVQCIANSCSLCDSIPQGTTIVDSTDGCKELKCISGRMKVGAAMGEVATCKKDDNNKPTWYLNETPIEQSTKDVCVQKKDCPDASPMCDRSDKERCIVDNEGVPRCSNIHQLTFDSQPANISCDTETGKWMHAGGSLPNNAVLRCTIPGKVFDSSKRDDPSGANVTLYAAAGVGIVVIAIVIVVGIYLFRTKKAKNNKLMGKDTTSKPAGSKSAESKTSRKAVPPPGPAPSAAPTNAATGDLLPELTARDRTMGKDTVPTNSELERAIGDGYEKKIREAALAEFQQKLADADHKAALAVQEEFAKMQREEKGSAARSGVSGAGMDSMAQSETNNDVRTHEMLGKTLPDTKTRQTREPQNVRGPRKKRDKMHKLVNDDNRTEGVEETPEKNLTLDWGPVQPVRNEESVTKTTQDSHTNNK